MTELKAPDYWSSLLLQIRTVKNWSQNELAEAIGVSRHTIIRWEQESKYPSPENQRVIGELASGLYVDSLFGIFQVVENSPFPMILTDRNDVVLASSKSSGFKSGQTVIEQTPLDEQENYRQFIKMVADTGFWGRSSNTLEYEFETDGRQRRAVVQSVGSRGHIFALVQKR
jgi:transcriptional regulator with XRE-family HTH domain